MRKIGVRELKNQATQVVRSVREDGAEYIITVQGQPVAVLRPFTDADAHHRLTDEEIERHLAELDQLAKEIAEDWISPLGAVEAVREQRRQL